MTLTFDLMIPKAERFISLPRGPVVVETGIKSVHSFSKHRVHKFGNGRTDGQTGRKHYDPCQSSLVEAQNLGSFPPLKCRVATYVTDHTVGF